MTPFNYQAPAELFPSKTFSRHREITYRRFVSAARAIQFVVEELGSEFLLSTTLEVDEKRFQGGDIRRLYEAPEYPLARATA